MPQARILHIITQLELGGAQLSTLELLRRLDRKRFTPTLMTAATGLLEQEARRIPGLQVRLVPSLVRPIRPWRDARCLVELTRLIRLQRFDVVHTHSSKAGIVGRWAAARAGVPVICHTIHGFGFHPEQPRWLQRAYATMERLTARRTTRLVAVSQATRDQGLARGIGSPEQYRQIHCGIDLQRFRRNGLTQEAARQRCGLRLDVPTIGTVACLKPQKAPGDFLRVCASVARQVPNLQAVLIGDGSLRAELERQRRTLGLEHVVHLVGWQHDIPTWLHALDVFLLTSRWEGLPISVLEAQALGVPVVATDTGGVRECLQDGVTGWLAPIGDVEALASRVMQFLTHADQAREMAARAMRDVVERFDINRMVQATESLYDEALAAVRASGVTRS